MDLHAVGQARLGQRLFHGSRMAKALAAVVRDGHQLQLLEGAREFYPALIEAVSRARTRIQLETYILDFTGSTQAVLEALMDAARRGVRVQMAVAWCMWVCSTALACRS